MADQESNNTIRKGTKTKKFLYFIVGKFFVIRSMFLYIQIVCFLAIKKILISKRLDDHFMRYGHLKQKMWTHKCELKVLPLNFQNIFDNVTTEST